MKIPSIISSILISAALLSAPNVCALSILDVRDNLDRIPVILPESFETDVNAMMQNWYLTNFADIDRQADSRSSVSPTDDEIIERLAAMPTIIEMPFNSVVRAHINAYTNRRKQLVENMLGMSLYYMPIFEQALDRQGLPLELKYLPVIESALNPDAVSRAGATGLWQFMLQTAVGEGLEVNSLVDERRDPYKSSEKAAAYLKKLYDIFGDWSLAIASYNCGPGNVAKAVRRAGDGKKDFWQIYPYLPAETRGYVPAFIAANYVMNYYDKHNISPALARRPIVTDTVHINRRVHFDQIRDVLGISIDELRALNPQYRKDIIPGDIKTYTLVLPSLQVYAYLAHEDSISNYNANLYTRRNVVEPAQAGTGSDSNGEFVEEVSTVWHTVKKGETLASIAKKYGVTQQAIRKTNKIGKRVNRGQKLKINIIKRRYIAPTPSVDTASIATDSIATDSTYVTTTPDSTVENQNTPEPVVQPQKPSTNVTPAKTTKPTPPAKPKTVKHRVKRGETLSKIATRYKVSINAIKKANNLKNDNIQVNQLLTIPSK